MINLKSNLVVGKPFTGPRNFHDRNQLELPRHKSLVQKQLDELKVYVDNEQMENSIIFSLFEPFLQSFIYLFHFLFSFYVFLLLL